jgi:hypothetical protein
VPSQSRLACKAGFFEIEKRLLRLARITNLRSSYRISASL